MGLFSDMCTACGAKVKKAAKFCSKCGTSPAKGWWRCSSCKKWIGAGSEFCPYCKTPAHTESRDLVAGGRWVREPGMFAQRFEVQDLEPLLRKGLTIETGCAAILLKDGRVKDVLEAGHHTLDNTAARILRWGQPAPKTIVLLDSAEVGIPVRVEGLHTKEDLPVEFYGEVIFRFDPKNAETLMQNFLKEKRELKVEEIGSRLEGEIRFSLTSHCQESAIHELITDPKRRLALEARLEGDLRRALDAIGLELERIGGCDFTGPEYEKLRTQSGDLEVSRRKLEMGQKLRDFMTSDRMGQLKSESEIEDYAAQLAQECDLGDEDRSHELGLLKQVHRHELEAVEASHQIEIRMLQTEAAVAERKVKFAQEVDEVEQALKWRRMKNEIRHEDMKAKAEIYSKQSIETLIALCEDPHQREVLLKLHDQQIKAGISEKDILADAQLDSLKAQQKMTEENAERLERVMREALKAMGEAAKGGHTIVK